MRKASLKSRSSISPCETFLWLAAECSRPPIAEGRGQRVKYDTTIVGVVGNIKHTDLRTELGPAVYQPYLQMKHPVGVVIYVQS